MRIQSGWILVVCSLIVLCRAFTITKIEPLKIELSQDADLSAVLSDRESEQHLGTLVEEIEEHAMDPSAFLSHARARANGSFDVCETRQDLKCFHQRCSDSAAVPAIGRIRRTLASALPRVAGNSPGSYCAVSHKFQFIFVHVLKNAGSMTKSWLVKALCPSGTGTCSDDTLSLTACWTAMRSFPEYFRWTWARHPFDRALSIYAMAKQYGLPADITFAQFWLDGSRWGKTRLSPDHGRPQSDFLADRSGCLALDFAGWLPNSQVEMQRIVDIIGAEPLQLHLETAGFEKPKKGHRSAVKRPIR